MEAVGQLAGGIAHDFNNMLTIVLGNLSTAQRRLRQSGEAVETIVRPLEAATEGAQGAARLTHRLLAFSRRQALAPSQIDLNRVISGVTDLVRRSIGETVEFETVLAADSGRPSPTPTSSRTSSSTSSSTPAMRCRTAAG